MEKELISVLMSIGLTEGESKVYIALLGLGPSKVGPIIEASGISASKSYLILDKLVEKGLASMALEQGIRTYIPSPPNMILDYLDQEKKKIESNSEKINKILPALNMKLSETQTEPFVEFTRGLRGFKNFYGSMINGGKVGDDYVTLAGYDSSMKLQAYWYPFSVRLSEKKISQYMVYEHKGWFEKDPIIHKRSERKSYYPRVLSKEYHNLPNIAIVGDIVVITHNENGEIISLKIHNKEMAKKFKKLLKIIRDNCTTPSGFVDKDFEV